MKRIATAALLGLSLCAQAHAAPADDPVAAAAASFVRGLVQEEDVALFFGYMREALDAAAVGREPPPPDRLEKRVEAIQMEAVQRGTIAGRVLLDVFEREIRDIIRHAAEGPAFSQSSSDAPTRERSRY